MCPGQGWGPGVRLRITQLLAAATRWMVVIFYIFIFGKKKIPTSYHFKITNLNKHLGENVSLVILGTKFFKRSRF